MAGTAVVAAVAAYQLASVYYGWKFGFDPAVGVLKPARPIGTR